MFENFRVEAQIFGESLVALLLGGVIGWERETAGKWAGLRTHMLVCLGAMLFVNIGQLLIFHNQQLLSSEILNIDPVRMVEAIVTGVAFLGAGTIFRDPDKNVARGLTTAASLLVTAPIGIAVAIHRLTLAVGLTLIVLFVLRVLGKIERKFAPTDKNASAAPAR